MEDRHLAKSTWAGVFRYVHTLEYDAAIETDVNKDHSIKDNINIC